MFTLQSVENHRAIDIFRRAAERNQALFEKNGLEVRLGHFQDCPFLKLDKPGWHNRGQVAVPGQIFFSVWMNDKGRLCYNIHALKLRHLAAYHLQSREFATAFRDAFEMSDWRNVSVGFGPQTLMEGWLASPDEIDSIIEKFCQLSPMIDDLLARWRR